jgi:ribonuclease J
MAKKLKISFLGGVGEIGKNMTVLEYGDDMIIVDAGLTFPNIEETPGVESVIPDYSYVKSNASRVRGIFVTHGHEDHIGGLPYVLKDIRTPVYGSNLSLGLLQSKLLEAKIDNAKLVQITDRQVVKAGVFSVEFIRVTHSVAGSYALSITTPKGVVFMSGDFKIDHTPIDGKCTDLARIAEIGEKGVLLLMMDSTNVERSGYSMSERNVFKALDAQFDQNVGKRIIVATFASNIHRVQQIINCAIDHGRRVAFSGRSMIKIAEIARTLGELKYPDNVVVDIEKIGKVPYDKVCIICTGTQGEPMSALTRMSTDDYKQVKITDLDTVLFSASAIPGNEKTIYNVINRLSKHGANVVYQALSEIHVSGHACKEELKLMFSLVRPKYFIPMHGEYRHLMQHKELALEMGIGDANIFIPEIGNCIEVDRGGVKRTDNVPFGELYVDGNKLISDNEDLMKDRKAMANDGCVIAVAKITLTNGSATEPVIIGRGIQLGDDIINEIKNDITSSVQSGDLAALGAEAAKARIRKTIAKKLQKRMEKTPVIIVIAEI